MYPAFWTSFISHSLFSICFLGHTSHLELAALWNHRGVVVMIVKPTGWTILPCMMHSLPIMSLYHSFNKPMPSLSLSVFKQGRHGLPKWGTSKFDGARKVVAPLIILLIQGHISVGCFWTLYSPGTRLPPPPPSTSPTTVGRIVSPGTVTTGAAGRPRPPTTSAETRRRQQPSGASSWIPACRDLLPVLCLGLQDWISLLGRDRTETSDRICTSEKTF